MYDLFQSPFFTFHLSYKYAFQNVTRDFLMAFECDKRRRVVFAKKSFKVRIKRMQIYIEDKYRKPDKNTNVDICIDRSIMEQDT
jgi:hypothetical protein